MVPKVEKPRVTEIKVRMDCNGCVQKIKKALHGITGIYDLYVDFPQQKITIIGWVDPEKIVKAIKKTRKTAVICLHTEPPDQAAQATDQSPENGPPPEGEAPPPESTSPPPESPQTGAAESPENPLPPENLPPEAKSSPELTQPKEAEQIHVVYYHPPEHGHRYTYGHNDLQQKHGGQWSGYTSGPQVRVDPPQPDPTRSGYRVDPYQPDPTRSGYRVNSYQPDLTRSGYRVDSYQPDPIRTEQRVDSYQTGPSRTRYRVKPSQPESSRSGVRLDPSQFDSSYSGYRVHPHQLDPSRTGFRVDPSQLDHSRTRVRPEPPQPEQTRVRFQVDPSQESIHINSTRSGVRADSPQPDPTRSGFRVDPTQPIYATHSYNTYRPSAYTTEYVYPRSPPRYTQYSRPNPYSFDYYSGNNGNGNITSMFSEEDPNSCRIV